MEVIFLYFTFGYISLLLAMWQPVIPSSLLTVARSLVFYFICFFDNVSITCLCRPTIGTSFDERMPFWPPAFLRIKFSLDLSCDHLVTEGMAGVTGVGIFAGVGLSAVSVSAGVVVLTSRCTSELLDVGTDDAEVWSGGRILFPARLHH